MVFVNLSVAPRDPDAPICYFASLSDQSRRALNIDLISVLPEIRIEGENSHPMVLSLLFNGETYRGVFYIFAVTSVSFLLRYLFSSSPPGLEQKEEATENASGQPTKTNIRKPGLTGQSSNVKLKSSPSSTYRALLFPCFVYTDLRWPSQ